MMRLHDHQRHKTSSQSTPVRLIGVIDYSMSMYCVYVVNQKCVVDTHNVVFDEHSVSHLAKHMPNGLGGIGYVHVPLLGDDSEVDDVRPSHRHVAH